MTNDCPYPPTKSVIVRGAIVEFCSRCQPSVTQPNELAASNRRNYQQGQYRRDTVQPFEKDYVKARGIDAAREKGWSDDAIRKFG